MRHEKVKVTRDTLTVHNLAVAPWEIPILEQVFDEGNVVATGEYVNLPDREYPNPAQEMTRLKKVYGTDGPDGPAHAVSVYGDSRNGIKALAKAIETAQQEEADAKPKRGARKASNKHAADSLLV